MQKNKTIHYCWFGKKSLPESAITCINSWRKNCPDFEIIEWNEDNFDVEEIGYIKDAYVAGKFAFVSDYARFKILYEHGGVYLDTDVELLKSIDALLCEQFLGFETETGVAPGLIMHFFAGNGFCFDMMNVYKTLDFKHEFKNGYTIVNYTTDMLKKLGFRMNNTLQTTAGIKLYPMEYFNPKGSDFGKLRITENTYSIHHFDASWKSEAAKLLQGYRQRYGRRLGKFLFLFCHPFKSIEIRREKGSK